MMHMFAIYRNPSDFPRGSWVVRGWDITHGQPKPKKEHVRCDTLREARSKIPPGMRRIPRDPKDDPCIVETWL